MAASQPQPHRGWELEDRRTPPPVERHARDMPDHGHAHGSPPRWPFHGPDDDKQPPPPPLRQPTGPPPFQQQQQQQQQQHQPAAAVASPKTSHTRRVISYWGLEIFTLFVAVCLLVAIIALLAYYDGRFMPEWPFDINLNSAIAFLSTFLRAAIVAAVAEIIGQIKWTWFAEQTRPLHHLQDFDAASRSILGSTKLLMVLIWNMGFTSAGLLAIGAATVTIVSLAVAPVTQQALRTGTCPMLQEDARSAIPAAHFVPGSSSYYRVGAGSYELEVDMKSTMIHGITDPRSQDSNVQVTCPSGNCTLGNGGTGVTHASIGMCSSCIDTTGFVSPPNEGGNLTLPDDGSYINILAGMYMWVGYSNLSAYTQLFTADFSKAAAVSIANFSMLMVSNSPCTSDNSTGIPKLLCPHRLSQSDNSYFDGRGDYVAASCVLYPCLKEYAGRYENNTLTEKTIRTTTAVAEEATSGHYAGFGNLTARQDICVLDNGTWYDANNQSQALDVPGRIWTNLTTASDGSVSKVPNACLYKMDGTFFMALSRFLSTELLKASCRYDSMQSGRITCFESWWLTPLWADMNATVAGLTKAVDDFAWAVTNKFRMTGHGPDAVRGDLDLLSKRAEVAGEVWTSTTCTYFDREYIALPVILVVLCGFLLGWIIVKNYTDPEQPVWKGSVLPLLFFGLHNTVGPRGEPGAKDDERLARNMAFFRENGRAAPELDRIQRESGRLFVRFHGGTDPGFLDLGPRKSDPEAAGASLVPDGAGKNDIRRGPQPS